MCAYLFWSKSKLIDKIKDLELKNNILEHMLKIKEEEIKRNQNLNQKTKTNSTYLWR